MNRIVDPLTRAIFDSDLISTRLTLAMAELCWCLMLLWPGDTFDRPTYTLMSSVASEWTWALIFGVTSFLQFVIVLQDDFHITRPRRLATWNDGIWSFVVGLIILSGYPPPTGAASPSIVAGGG